MINLRSEYARKYSFDKNKSFLSDKRNSANDTEICNKVKFAEPLPDPSEVKAKKSIFKIKKLKLPVKSDVDDLYSKYANSDRTASRLSEL